MKKTLLAFIALLFLVIATGCATETAATNEGRKTITVAHELGEVQVVKNPQNVVVLDFGMLDTMDKLGIQVTGIPKNNLPEYLSHFNTDEFSSVGGLRELDFEAIHALNPELIIISARQIEQYEELSDIAPTIFLGVDATDYMNSFKKNVHTLGKIFDQSDKIDESLTQIDETIAQIKEKAQGNSALVVLASEGSVSAFGPGSRFGLIHEELGFTPVDENIEVSRHGQSISFEYILEKNPDYLFVIDRSAVVGNSDINARQTIENDLVRKTDAYKNGRIVYLNPNYWYLSGGGLVSVSEMMQQILVSLQ